MFRVILSASVLVAITVMVHVSGLVVLLRYWLTENRLARRGFWATSWLLVRLTWFLLMLHALEITIWALFYLWQDCLPDAESAIYFSGVTYATVGYGDLVLPKPWRILGPVEGLAGILMCALSTGLFLATVSKFVPLGIKREEHDR